MYRKQSKLIYIYKDVATEFREYQARIFATTTSLKTILRQPTRHEFFTNKIIVTLIRLITFFTTRKLYFDFDEEFHNIVNTHSEAQDRCGLKRAEWLRKCISELLKKTSKIIIFFKIISTCLFTLV